MADSPNPTNIPIFWTVIACSVFVVLSLLFAPDSRSHSSFAPGKPPASLYQPEVIRIELPAGRRLLDVSPDADPTHSTDFTTRPLRAGERPRQYLVQESN